MSPGRRAALIAIAALAMLWGGSQAQAQLACSRFTQDPSAAPAPRTAESAVRRFEVINAEVESVPHRILFLGDSITERYDGEVWQRDMAPRGVLNAGVSGDRTENLLWRLGHGNLAGKPATGVILLIGTNDLTSGGNPRPPAAVAEGIRTILLYLRQHLPNARILLLGLYPREDVPRLVPRIPEVNRLIRSCNDGHAVVYADIGGVLVEPDGHLSRAVSPDLLHFSRLGYERLASKLDPLIDNVIAGR
jgi:beta-glucosidase